MEVNLPCVEVRRKERGLKEVNNMNEFAINWLKGADYAEVSAPSGSALKSKLMSLAEKYPEDVTNIIINKDGSIFCHIPVSYVKVSHPKRISEEQKEAAAERFRKMRQKNEII